MDEFKSVDEESPDRYSPNRRSVMKAIGATAAVGGVFPGAVTAQQACAEGGCSAGTGDDMCQCAHPSCDFLAKVDASGQSVTISVPESAAEFDSVAVKVATCCYPVSYSGTNGQITVNSPTGQDISNVSFFRCGNGGEGRVNFYGCSQVCSDTQGTSVTYVDANGVTQTGSTNTESNRNDPAVRDWDAVYCFEVPEGSAIVSAGGQENPNRCAENYA
ncbi:hypothetical protein GS429_14280 [Natronorubrum sp. JWXQ-INN-674]|uniref:Twin-arginine translocation signal domain-containing protein n=1 Tax=Natronorubrum halalkaliphilum TaxID=2691917 RepID=A0A6B0VPW9_9EURY|nr:hypothetical protein [Natronorubrum halalkaliphilum]MXV63213.1 hypothetical protein [Natronorubrum halalkaliphilum]